jgi:hypothetical protein
MHPLHRFRFATVCLFASLAAQAFATPVLYYTPTTLTNGLGRPSSSQFTQAVVAAFGASNVVEIPTFNDTSLFADGAALFVNARNQSDTLSTQERTNLLSFITAGGAVFFVGDHGSWEGWDNSFLSLFGDSFHTWNGVGAAISTGALPDQFTPNTQILLTAPGAINGGNGTPLFTTSYGGFGRHMAALYGPYDNAIAFLDTNAFGYGSNTGFYTGVSSWLFTAANAYDEARLSAGNPGTDPSAVPDTGAAIALIAPAMLGLAALRRGGRRGFSICAEAQPENRDEGTVVAVAVDTGQ